MVALGRWSRVRFGLSIGIVLAVITVLASGIFFLRRSSGSAQGGSPIVFVGPASLSASITYDGSGIPLVRASSYTNAAAGWGYVAAQERLFQIYEMLWTGSGTLAAHLGAGPGGAYTSSDMLFASLNLTATANADYVQASSQTQSVLQAYAQGVNAWVATNPLPHEFQALGITPASLPTWTGQDSTLLADEVSSDLDIDTWAQKIIASALAATSPQLAAALVPAVPDSPSMFDAAGNLESPAQFDAANPFDGTSLASARAQVGTSQSQLAQRYPSVNQQKASLIVAALSRLRSALPDFSGIAGGRESNNFAVAGKYTTTGMALVANDPQLTVQEPTETLPIEIQVPGLSLSGVGISGIPGYISFLAVHSGGPTIASSMTFTLADDADVRVETLRSVSTTLCPSGQQASINGTWQCVSERTVTIQVAGGQAVPLTLLSTPHGPILNPAFAGALDPLGQLSLQTTAASSSWSIDGFVGGGQGYLPLPLASSQSTIAAAIHHISIGFNVVYADNQDIGYGMSGELPIRNSANGLGIVPGADPRYEWTGFEDPAQLPSAYDPTSGILVTANNRILPSTAKVYVTNSPDLAFRAQEIEKQLEGMVSSGHKISVGDLARLQLDVHSDAADVMLPALLQVVQSAGVPAALQPAVAALQGWNDNVTASSQAAAIFEPWVAILTRDLAVPDTGAIYPLYSQDIFITIQVEAAYLQLENPTVMSVAQRNAWAVQALNETVRLLTTSHISTWGDLHRLVLEHPFAISGTPYFDASYENGPATGSPVGGAFDTPDDGGWFVNIGTLADSPTQLAAAGGPQAAFREDATASARVVWSLAAPSTSVGVCLTGVSGEPGPHYDDLTSVWLAGQDVPFWS